MKTMSILPNVIALCLPALAVAQERVTINGILSDGTPPPSPPPKVLHKFEILSTEVIQLERRKIIINRVENPGFPDPTPRAPAVIDPATVAAFKGSPAYLKWQEKQQRTTSLCFSASVVDNQATFLQWREEGKEYQAWSNIDFKYLTGFSSFSKGDRSYVPFMGLTDFSSTALRNESLFKIPVKLPKGAPDFMMIQGTAGESEGYDVIAALHQLYATDGQRLREAYELLVARQKEVAAKLRANPPAPKNIIFNFWKVEPSKKEAEAQARPARQGKGRRGN